MDIIGSDIQMLRIKVVSEIIHRDFLFWLAHDAQVYVIQR